MYLVSTSKTTILSDFNLDTKADYEHANGEATDFQFFYKHGLFVEINPKSGLEVMRVKKMNQRLNLQRVRKLNIDKATSVACAKQSMEEIAIGLANGYVKIFNINSTETIHRFNPDSNRNAILFLDYNFSDEYLASVYENGLITIFGMKTKAKIESINIDGSTTLARFHPTKRFNLAIASYKGSVTIYDSQAKKKTFHSSKCHAAPCRDLCISSINPHTVISVGYDSIINIFDTRRRANPTQVPCLHPLSAVALSDCGNYLCVGNLKGELSTLDLRNTAKCLNQKKVHDSAVSRLGFVPNFNDSKQRESSMSALGILSNQNQEDSRMDRVSCGGNATADLRKSIINKFCVMEGTSTPQLNKERRDSLLDFLDFQNNKNAGPAGTSQRESFDWGVLNREISSDGPRTSLFPMWSGLSSITSNNSGSAHNSCESLDGKRLSSDSRASMISASSILRQNSIGSNMSEEFEPKNIANIKLETGEVSNELKNENKENHHQNTSENVSKIPMSNNSTPLGRFSNPVVKNTISSMEEVCKQINDLRLEINEGFKKINHRVEMMESEINYVAENNKFQILTQNSNLSVKTMNALSEMNESIFFLCQTDPFVTEYIRLKEENEQLKKEIQSLTKNTNK